MDARGTVLVADDHDQVRQLIVLVLARAALAAVEARDGDAALALARRLRPDLVLLDAVMPGRDGVAVCAALKADPVTAAVPVVLLTGQSDPQVRERAAAAGADGFLTKPFSPAALVALVRELLPG
jgi:CheY-like chemotaxis protein